MWPRIAQGLRIIGKRTNPAWTPGIVLDALEQGRAFLYASEGGWVVLEIQSDHRERYLNVWLAHFSANAAKAKRSEFVAWLDDVAMRAIGSTDWRFSSPRKGWAGLEPDCEVHTITWRRKRK